MNVAKLQVDLPGRRVGALESAAPGRVRWAPDRAWQREGQHPRLGASFLRRPGMGRPVPGIPVWFENLLPEKGSELRRRLCAAHGLRENQSFQLLARLGDDLLGAVRVRSEDADAALAGESSESSSGEPEQLGLDLSKGRGPWMSALTGMQLKFSMSMVDHRMVLPAEGQGGAWILKLAGRDFPGLAEVEHATMRWAARAGFEVPEHRVLPLEELRGLPLEAGQHDPSAFAIRRFDRRDDGTRIHQEDLCQALDLEPGNKYGHFPQRVAFDGALAFVTDVCGEPSGREMARRMGFCIAAGNGDAHLKNWSLSWGERTRPVLTPCYDVVSTIAWRQQLGWGSSSGPTLALRIGRVARFAELGREALDRLDQLSRLSWASEEIVAGAKLALSTWSEIEPDAPERMRAAVREHRQAVPLLSAL